jgi:hypothetical protein
MKRALAETETGRDLSRPVFHGSLFHMLSYRITEWFQVQLAYQPSSDLQSHWLLR